MPERKGMHRTTQPRTAEGQDLPATLPNHLVGPSITTDPDLRKEAEGATEFVVEQLDMLPARANTTAIMAVIVGVLQQLYEPLVVTALKQTVFDCLVRQGHLRRASSSHKNVVYDVQPPKKEPLTKDEAMRKLIGRVEELTNINHDLKAELAEAKAGSSMVDPSIIEQLATKLESANQRIEQLTEELADAHRATEQGSRQHHKELTSLRTELTEAKGTIARLEGEALTRQSQNATLDPETATRLRALGIRS